MNEHWSIFPDESVAVIVMVSGTPTGIKVPLATSATVVDTSQLSVDTGKVISRNAPQYDGSLSTVKSVGHTAVGAILSSTVMEDVQVFVLPELSVTVKVTVFAVDKFVQSNVEGLTAKLAIPQLSVLPLFTSLAVIDPSPLASNCSVKSWHDAIGSSVSFTVTVKVQLAVLPAASVAETVTVVEPIEKDDPDGKSAEDGSGFAQLSIASSKV